MEYKGGFLMVFFFDDLHWPYFDLTASPHEV